MKRIKKKMVVLFFILIIFLICITPFSCQLYKYVSYQTKVGEYLPDTFRIELPLQIDYKDYFCITARINHQENIDFVIDTKAVGDIKADDLEKLNANYKGTLPIPTTNMYGQKQKFPYYTFDSFEIQSLSFKEPPFMAISQTNLLYDIMHKNILGLSVLTHLYWKFSIDEEKMILFSKNDTTLIKKETEGYIKIEKGLSKFKIIFPLPFVYEQKDFICDLGFSGEIAINRKSFEYLSKQYTFKKILTARAATIDTTYVFDGIDIQWNNITVSNCQAIYTPLINRNIIGAKLMQRFNFILVYGDYTGNTQRHLYIKPVKHFQNIKSIPYVSGFGFSIGKKSEKSIISGIEVGSLADSTGLKVNDRLISIDNGAFKHENNYNNLIMYLADKKQVTVQVERDEQIIDIQIIKH